MASSTFLVVQCLLPSELASCIFICSFFEVVRRRLFFLLIQLEHFLRLSSVSILVAPVSTLNDLLVSLQMEDIFLPFLDMIVPFTNSSF